MLVSSSGGFINPPGATSIFGFRGFTATSGQRILETANLDTTNYETLQFSIIQGTSANGGEATDTGDNMVVYYSVNGGSSWTTLVTYTGSPRNYTSWTQIDLSLPSGAKASSVKFKWVNLHTASGDYDHWGVSLIRLHNGSNIIPSFKVSNNGTDNIQANAAGVTLVGDAITLSGPVSATSSFSVTGSTVLGTTQISSADINGGTIDGVNIGNSVRGAGNFSSVYITGSNPIILEGQSGNSYETRLWLDDPTQDNTITFPNESGKVHTSGGVMQLFTASADPTTNLAEGQMYFNSTTKQFRGYNGTSWVTLG